VKRTNLNIFYQLGKSIANFDKVSIGMTRSDMVMELVIPRMWLWHFIEETKQVALPKTKEAAQKMYDVVNGLLVDSPSNWRKQLSQEERQQLTGIQDSFESNFEEETKRLAVFTVLPKGIYDIMALITTPEDKFPPNTRALLPPQMIADLKQSALCLAFEIPTACAFYVCRGTEALMLAYHQLLTKKPWPFSKKDWKIYIEQLRVAGAPKKITARLDEIREMDRNAYAHPDTNVSIEEAPVLFELCTGVVFYMGQEMEKLT